MKSKEDNLFSIGEVADLLGISVQTLRYYDKIGIVEPAYINMNTGYRYYSYIQISLIDRIRYLQDFGMSLNEIGTAFQDGHVKALVPYLEKQLSIKSKELQKLRDSIDTLRWYISFFRYPDQPQYHGLPYKRTLEARYILAVDCVPHEAPIRDSNHPSTASLELRKIRTDPIFQDVTFLRKHGNLLFFRSTMAMDWDPYKYYIYLKGEPGFEHPNLIRLPAGDYLCFQGKPLANEWDTSIVSKYFQSMSEANLPVLVIADEYENKLNDFLECIYEFQIPIGSVNGENSLLFTLPDRS